MVKRLLLSLFFVVATQAQSVTVTGTVTDVTGVPATSGYVEFKLSPSSSAIAYRVQGTAIVVPQTMQCGINGSGQVKKLGDLASACQLWGNDVIAPANTCYDVTYAPGGVRRQTIPRMKITGATYDLSQPVFCTTNTLVPQYTTLTGPPHNFNLMPGANNAFNVGASGLKYAAGYFVNLFVDNFTWLGSFTINTATINTATIGELDNIFIAGGTKYPTVVDAMAAAQVAGGTVYVKGGHTEILTSPLNVGSAATPVDLVLGNNVRLIFNVTSGSSTDAVRVFNRSSIRCIQTGNGGNFVLASTANVRSLVANGDRTGAQQYYTLANCGFEGHTSATYEALVDAQAVYDSSRFDNITVWNFHKVGVRIQNAAGGVGMGPFQILNPHFNGVGGAGDAKPLLIKHVTGGGAFSGISIIGGGLHHEGAAAGCVIDIDGNGGTALRNVSLTGAIYSEVSNAGSKNICLRDVKDVVIDGFDASGVASTDAISITESAPGLTDRIYIKANTGHTNLVNNAITSVVTTVAPYIYNNTGAAYFDGGVTVQPTKVFNMPTTNIIASTGILQFGTGAANPAESGSVRFGTGDSLKFRNFADGADKNGLSKDGADVVQVGDVEGTNLSGPQSLTTTNGASVTQNSISELITLNTGGTTTDSSADLLPANSIIDAVVARVTTTITAACTGWSLGDPTSANRFTANNTTLTAGTTDVGLLHMAGNVATTALGPTQAAAAKVRITCAGGNPGAGAIRVTVFYRQFVPPTS